MAGETQSILPELTVSSQQVNSIANSIYYILIGLVLFAILALLIYRWNRKRLHNIHVTVHKKVGDAIVKDTDWAMKEYKDGNYIFHYFYLNKRSPIVPDQRMKIVRLYKLGLRLPFTTYSVMGFDAYFQDGKLCPMTTNEYYNDNGELADVTITPIDYDAFNFMVNEIEAYQNKKNRVDKLMQLAPYAMFLLVIIAFIVGMVLYTKHLESMSQIWLQSVKESTNSIISKIGELQIIPQG